MTHKIIGYIADRNLNSEVRNRIIEDFNINSLADVALWADWVREERSQHLWHFANVAKNERVYNRNRDCPDGECVVEKIHYFAKQLTDPGLSHAEHREALMYLVHFVSDVHQPLHMGNLEDRGGNGVKFHYLGEETNLHALWDQGLVSLNGRSLLQYAGDLNRRISSEERKVWAKSDVVDWANESRVLALDVAYAVPENPNHTLTKQYIRQSREIIDRRMSQAGVRLAYMINSSLGR